MKRILWIISNLIVCSFALEAQNFELMPGSEKLFVDAQWLKNFDTEYKWTLFSRSRATDDYHNNTNLFTGAYLNYTTSLGIGATLLGRLSSIGSGMDTGIHFFTQSDYFVIYALASVELRHKLAYSWFSIARYTPSISEKWRIYISLELFSNFLQGNHIASVQRIRTGLSHKGYQFGLAINLSGLGNEYSPTNSNPGIFIRKEF